jgi:hypothetical protein
VETKNKGKIIISDKPVYKPPPPPRVYDPMPTFEELLAEVKRKKSAELTEK